MHNSIMTAIAFILIFGTLVTIHEFGHFIAAKRAGVLVREFAIGMGPKIFQVTRRETAYTLRLLPVGGYVRMAGSEEEAALKPGQSVVVACDAAGQVTTIDARPQPQITGIAGIVDRVDFIDALTLQLVDQADQVTTYVVSPTATVWPAEGASFMIAPRQVWLQSASVYWRMVINLAGPAMNFLLAIAVCLGIAFTQTTVASNRPVIGQVIADYPAAQAGLAANDHVTAINGKKITSWQQLQLAIRQQSADPITVTVSRGSQTITKQITPKILTSGKQRAAQLGITPVGETSWQARCQYGITYPWQVATSVTTNIAHMATRGIHLNELGGPVMIAKETSTAAKGGAMMLFLWLAILSVNLGIMNLLPIPALDGGKFLLNLLEMLRRKPLPVRFERYVTIAGAVVMLGVMLLVTINDLLR